MRGDNIIVNLKQGITIGFYTKLATQLINFIFGILLARLLTPEDYGLIGVLAVFLIFIDHIIDSGFGAALLQQKKVELIDYNTVFLINILLAILLYLIFFLSAPWIADFYEDNRLIPIVKLLGLVSLIKAFGSTQGAYLNKCQHYISQAKVYYISMVSGSIIALIFALIGYGYWALIIKSIFNTLLLTVGWWIISPWKPKIQYSVVSVKKLFSFGSKLLGTSLFESIFNNIYSLVIGKLFNISALGYYNRANGFFNVPDMAIRQTLIGQVFPALSYFQEEDQKLKRLYEKILLSLAFTLYPIYAIMFFSAHPMISFLLTDKWIVAAPLLQILCIKALFFPFESINGNILYVKGKSNLVLKSTFWRRIIFVFIILVTFKFGVKGLLWGLVIDAFVVTFLNYRNSQKIFKFHIAEQLKIVSKTIIILIPSIVIMILSSHFIQNVAIKFLLIVTGGSLSYLILSYLILRRELFEVLSMLKIEKIFQFLFKNI